MCLQIDGIQQESPDESEFLQIDVELAGGAFQDFAGALSPPEAHSHAADSYAYNFGLRYVPGKRHIFRLYAGAFEVWCL